MIKELSETELNVVTGGTSNGEGGDDSMGNESYIPASSKLSSHNSELFSNGSGGEDGLGFL